MTGEFDKIETQNNVKYKVHYKRDKHGVIKEVDRQVVSTDKAPKPNKLKGRKSKRNDYTPSQGTISEHNCRKIMFKNIKTHSKNDKETFNGTITYIADLSDTKNKNGEIVELLYNNGETIERATTKEKKLQLADKAYDDFLIDANAKKYSKKMSKHSVFSLPPSLNIPREQQAKILQETIIKTIDEMEEFKDHKYLLAIHEDQMNSESGVHCHIVMAQYNKDGQSLDCSIKDLKKRDDKFKQKMVFNLYKDYGIELENHKKPPFTPDLHKELTFLEVIEDKRVKVMDKLGEIRELKFKGCDEEVKKHNLQMGDRFDYVTEKTDEFRYIKGKKQYKINRKFENIVTQEQIREQVKQIQEQEQKQIIENRPENKLAREIEELEKSISGFKGIFKTKSQKAEIKEEIENRKLAKFIIENKDTIANLSETDIAMTYYAYNPYISSDEKKQIIEQAPHIKHTYTIGVNFPKIAQYLDDDIRKSIRERIVNPYKAIDKAINEEMEKNTITFKHLQKSDKQKAQQKIMQKALIERCPDITNHNKGLKQLQEKEEREHKQYIESFIARHKTPDKSPEIKPNTPTRTIPPKQKKDKEKDRER